MNILYLHQYFVPPDGSGGTRSYEMARRFVAAGHRVTMLTSSAFFPDHYELKGPVDNLELDGISLRVVHVPYSNHFPYIRRINAFLRFALKAIVEVLRLREVDIVFASSTPLTIAFPAIAAKVRHRSPMVFEVRDLWPEVPTAMGALRNPVAIWGAKLLEKWVYWSSARVVALSPGMRDGIVRTGYPIERVAVIPNSCDVALFRVPDGAREQFLAAHPYLKGGPLITYTGTLGSINGVEYMVEVAYAMRKLNPSVRFLIIGDGRQKELVLDRAERLDVLGKNLWMMSPLPKKLMPQVLAATTVAASLVIDLPELWNNSANKFFDALAAGRPVLVNYSGWQADLLEDSGAGLVVPPRDPKSAAHILQGFLTSGERVAKARREATSLADNVFNRDQLADKLRHVLEGIVDEGRTQEST